MYDEGGGECGQNEWMFAQFYIYFEKALKRERDAKVFLNCLESL